MEWNVKFNSKLKTIISKINRLEKNDEMVMKSN